jgi:hypothetical protein
MPAMAPPAATPPRAQRSRAALTLGLLAGFAVTTFSALWLIDYFVIDAGPHTKGPAAQLFGFDADTMANALGSLAQVIAAVLGIAITVVSIVVQLAANRYTSRVTDMFFRDRTNLAVMGFFVVACIEALWVSFGVTKDYVPEATITATLVMATTSLLLLVPYFAYVFDFLDPEKVIARIGAQTLESAAPSKRHAGASTAEDPAASEARQTQAVSGLEQLAGIAMNALAQKEKTISSDATAALRTVLCDYLPEKPGLPATWFGLSRGVRSHADFVAMDPGSLEELVRDKAWLEWIGLRQLREVFSEALKTLPEMTHVVAIDTRYIGEAAIDARDREVLALTIKFLNTYLRSSLNARDVRTCYNVLHQYRQLAEAMLRVPGTAVPWLQTMLEDVAGHFKYYAQLGHAMGLGFVAETAAYDLCALCEVASDLFAPCHDRLLSIFLEIDKEAETTAEERALRGVRKAQVKLATFYLLRGHGEHARAIYEDMVSESPERLRSIRDEMLGITSKQFWEVVDRGTNFDYLDDARKEKLRVFFAQFEALNKLPPRAKGTGPYRVTGP